MEGIPLGTGDNQWCAITPALKNKNKRPKLNFQATHSYGVNTPTTAELKLLLDTPECRGGAEKK